MSEKISVVIPTYKRKVETIKKTIGSVSNQTYKNVEVILVNDNGPSNYTEELKEFAIRHPNLKYIEHKKNKGACAARNTGIENASGEYIAFLDDDDTWEYDKLRKQINQFTNDNIGLVYCGIKYTYEKTGKTICKKAFSTNNPVRELVVNNYIGSTSCGMVRKSSAIRVGMFDENLKSGQDLDFWIRLAKEFDLAFVEDCLLNYTVYEENTITSNYNNRLSSNIYLRNKYEDIFKNDIELKTIYTMKIFKAYLKLKKIKNGLSHLKYSISNNEFSTKSAIKYYIK